jgi:hypothetical protein
MKSFYIILIILLSSGASFGQVTIDIKEYDELKADQTTLKNNERIIVDLNDSIKNINKQLSNLRIQMENQKKEHEEFIEQYQSDSIDYEKKFQEKLDKKDKEAIKNKPCADSLKKRTIKLIKLTAEKAENKKEIEGLTSEKEKLTKDLAPYKEFKSKNMKELKSSMDLLYFGEFKLNNKEYLLIKKNASILYTTFPSEKEIIGLQSELNKYNRYCKIFNQVEASFKDEYNEKTKNDCIKLIERELTSKEQKSKELVEKLHKSKERLNGHCKLYIEYYEYLNKLQVIIGDGEFETFKKKLLTDKLESKYEYIYDTLKDYAISTENPFKKAANISCK